MRHIKRNLLYICCLILCILSASCRNGCIVQNIEISDGLATYNQENGVDYCTLVDDALTYRGEALKQLSLLDCENSWGYEHGAVLLGILTQIGEEKFIKSISDTNKQERNTIESYIEVGIEYRDLNLKGRELKDLFPNLYQFLNE